MSIESTIWTVGHSNQEQSDLIALLDGEGIEVVVDVRSSPWSRYVSQFNRENLEPSLRNAGIKYLFMGDSLGGRPIDESHYDADGHAVYALMAETDLFNESIRRLVAGSRESRIALLCAEADPEHCHRRLLVGKVLCENGIGLRHILKDGSVEEEASVRLPGDSGQESLLGGEEIQWRSTQSVSPKAQPSTSSND